MSLPDFEVLYRLSPPNTRTPRSTTAELQAAFPGERQVRFLGAGAFGETWRVGQRAVKVIVADTFDEARIAREIGAATVTSPNVVTYIETMTLFAGGEDRVALVFEYVKGHDLATVVGENGALDVSAMRALAVGLLKGTRAMHAAGVIHRDLKPENVQLRMDSPAKPVILDLGLAYVAEATSLTQYPAAIGTRAFMPPEVLRGEHAVQRSDMYSLGVTLYIAATGRHPFMSDDEVIRRSDLAERVEGGAKLNLSDSALAELIVRMLNPQAFRRPSAQQSLRALKE